MPNVEALRTGRTLKAVTKWMSAGCWHRGGFDRRREPDWSGRRSGPGQQITTPNNVIAARFTTALMEKDAAW
jgi:hypothetical protein